MALYTFSRESSPTEEVKVLLINSNISRTRYYFLFRSNDSDHRKQFAHPNISSRIHSDKQKCRYGNGCRKYV